MTQPAHSQDRIDEYGILPHPVHGIIIIVEDEHVKPRGMGEFRRDEASGMLRACVQGTKFPDASPPRVDHDCGDLTRFMPRRGCRGMTRA